ncbi:acyl-CoA thioesterase [Porticoccaceae bacterium]|nr:acyl-CoA thioesterase [Porticoccaceae bacterium]
METQSPSPSGKLISQTIAMPRETNANGDIFGGWLLSQMDLAGAILAGRIAKGRVATVAISGMSFLNPVPVGAVVACYAQTLSVGTSSIRVLIEAWIDDDPQGERCKVTEGEFVFVAIDDNGNTRQVPTA